MRQLTNDENACFSLPKISKLDNTRVRMIIALYIHAFMSGCDSHDEFKSILNKLCGSEDRLKLEEDTFSSHKLPRFYQWSKIAAAKYTVGDNMPLLKK